MIIGTDLHDALARYVGAVKACRYWQEQSEFANRVATQRVHDFRIAHEQREAALADLIKAAEEVR